MDLTFGCATAPSTAEAEPGGPESHLPGAGRPQRPPCHFRCQVHLVLMQAPVHESCFWGCNCSPDPVHLIQFPFQNRAFHTSSSTKYKTKKVKLKSRFRGIGGKESACQCRRCKGLGFDSLGQEDPLEKEMATHSSILA